MTLGIARQTLETTRVETRLRGDLKDQQKEKSGKRLEAGGARVDDRMRARAADGLRAARKVRATDVRPASVWDHVAASILLCLPPSFAVLAVLILSPVRPSCQPVPLRRPLPPRPFLLTVMAEKDATARLRRAVKGVFLHLCMPASA